MFDYILIKVIKHKTFFFFIVDVGSRMCRLLHMSSLYKL